MAWSLASQACIVEELLYSISVERVLKEIKLGIYPDIEYLNQFNPEDRKIILDAIPYVAESSLLKDKRGIEVDLDNQIIEKEKEKKTIWNFD